MLQTRLERTLQRETEYYLKQDLDKKRLDYAIPWYFNGRKYLLSVETIAFLTLNISVLKKISDRKKENDKGKRFNN